MMQKSEDHAAKIVVILSGGAGRRLGGVDKGEMMLGSRRLIDHVIDRLVPQVDRLLISAAHNYGSGLTAIADRDGGPHGPAAGVWAAAHWIRKNLPEQKFFVTVPADGPFVPDKLVVRLLEVGACSFVATHSGPHPTFACWEITTLLKVLEPYSGKGVALQEVARACSAAEVPFPDGPPFMNINTPQELTRAEGLLDQGY